MRIHLSSLQLSQQRSEENVSRIFGLHQQTEESIKDLQTKLDNVAQQVAKSTHPQLDPNSVQLEMLNGLKSQQAAFLKQVGSRHAEVQWWQADMQKRIHLQHSELLAAIQNQQNVERGGREGHRK